MLRIMKILGLISQFLLFLLRLEFEPATKNLTYLDSPPSPSAISLHHTPVEKRYLLGENPVQVSTIPYLHDGSPEPIPRSAIYECG